MNATTEVILARLDRVTNKSELVTPGDIAAAYGMSTARAVIEEIELGRLAANAPRGRYIIAREEARRYIMSNGK